MKHSNFLKMIKTCTIYFNSTSSYIIIDGFRKKILSPRIEMKENSVIPVELIDFEGNFALVKIGAERIHLELD